MDTVVLIQVLTQLAISGFLITLQWKMKNRQTCALGQIFSALAKSSVQSSVV